MLYRIIICSSAFLAFLSCHTQKQALAAANEIQAAEIKNVPPMKKSRQPLIYFKEGENKFLKEYEMNIAFKSISEDSRCPKGVNCIWIGAAVAQLEMTGTYTRPVTVAISTVDNAGRKYSRSAEFNGYTITLEEVTPYPESSGGSQVLPGKYSIGISIQRQGEKTDAQSGVTKK